MASFHNDGTTNAFLPFGTARIHAYIATSGT
jgi:hypothetical protein